MPVRSRCSTSLRVSQPLWSTSAQAGPNTHAAPLPQSRSYPARLPFGATTSVASAVPAAAGSRVPAGTGPGAALAGGTAADEDGAGDDTGDDVTGPEFAAGALPRPLA